MKNLKFAMAFVASLQMSFSQVAFAAAQIKQYPRIELSELQLNYLSEDTSFKDLYKARFATLGGQNRALFSEWIKEFGNEKLPAFTTERSRSDSGADVLTLSANKFGQTYTFKLSSDSPEAIEINGQKVTIDNFQNPQMVLSKLSTDEELPEYLPMTTNWDKDSFLSSKQFVKLSPIEKVKYLQMFREALEAAETVHQKSQQKLSQKRKGGTFSFIQMLVGMQEAWADGAGLPKLGEQCVVAGNSGSYKPTRAGALSCYPAYDAVAAKVQPSCGGGKQVLCNPLVYGLSSEGQPFCLDSSNRSQFTSSATAQCNAKSPLAGEPGSDERNQSYERILKSYFVAKNGKDKEGEIASCFNKESKVKANSQCEQYFTTQIAGFKTFLEDTLHACDTNETLQSMSDQQSACHNLRQRALDLSTYTDQLMAGLVVIDSDKRAPASEIAPAVKAEEKKKCKSDNKLSCKGGLWMWLVGAGLLAFLLLRNNKAEAKTPPPIPSVEPTPVVPRIDVVTIPVTTPPPDCREFGSCPEIPATPTRQGAR